MFTSVQALIHQIGKVFFQFFVDVGIIILLQCPKIDIVGYFNRKKVFEIIDGYFFVREYFFKKFVMRILDIHKLRIEDIREICKQKMNGSGRVLNKGADFVDYKNVKTLGRLNRRKDEDAEVEPI